MQLNIIKRRMEFTGTYSIIIIHINRVNKSFSTVYMLLYKIIFIKKNIAIVVFRRFFDSPCTRCLRKLHTKTLLCMLGINIYNQSDVRLFIQQYQNKIPFFTLQTKNKNENERHNHSMVVILAVKCTFSSCQALS